MAVIYTLIFIASMVARVQAIELVEMTDANRAILNVNLANSLRDVQEAFGSDFKFGSVKDAKKFLTKCAYVISEIDGVEDSAYEGLAGRIKAVIAETSIAQACSVKQSKLSKFDDLDIDFGRDETEYLSRRRLNKLVELNRAAKANAGVNVLLRNLINRRIEQIAGSSLDQASSDVEIFFGDYIEPTWFSVNYVPKKRCEIGLIKPICKLVRRSDEDTPAIGKDLADFAKIVQDDKALDYYEKQSGVSLDQVKGACQSMKYSGGSFLKPIEQIEYQVQEGLIDDQSLVEKRSSDKDLDFYYELYNLCRLVTTIN